ncbi:MULTISPECIES: 1-phosphofructokinase family hexose kinase [unclassified Gemella]|uniref:1-phosphofructokinase family hexose kinase n=1 Tax=unclassified Gemella TaxID=2624949 RepID=UPI0010745583|nr:MULTISPECIES: 1-phosphofructokinase family hexose kinase [unclassified Gemella]MBF0710533.1 1-phosphofructokinase family hexose kinase [Gemella sp. GL1.1]MBF0747210.1 1-phosphofructokinase family hexose kinase [Gemella sp. 19428wG2_WT2a]NYS27877.1 1-phosphofructokinase family hexose kinase [Gemella sp. GL1]TFU58005.1 1-phosphofructokinase family hexose kinase [Gemella sp. WT2a]
MYYTITLNPAIDMLTRPKSLQLGKLNRTEEADYIVGGKGINISLLLNNIGQKSMALGFVAGFTGAYIKSELARLAIDSDFVETSGNTRINIKLIAEEETEINGQSSPVTADQLAEFYKKLDILRKEDTVFLSGNIIGGMQVSDFANIAKKISESGAKLIVDSNKDLVLDSLIYKPFLVKPNEFELGEMFGVEIKSVEHILTYAKKLQDLGAENVLVSRGGEGAILLTKEGEFLSVNVAKGEIISTAAAGDSMLAMFIAKYDESKSFEEALKYASAAGGATSFSAGVGKKELIDSLLAQISVKKLQ